MAPNKIEQTVTTNGTSKVTDKSEGFFKDYLINHQTQAKAFSFLSIVCSYSYYFSLQEALIADKKLNLSVSVVNGIECLICILVASLILTINAPKNEKGRNVSALSQLNRGDFKVGVLLFGSKYLSGFSLKFVSFPFAKLFKSAKVIPIAFVGALRGLYKMTWIQYVNAVSISVGLFIFQLYKPSKQDVEYKADMIGVALLSMSLIFDGFSQTQTDKQFRKTERSFAYAGMLGNNLVGLFINVAITLYYINTKGDDTHVRILNDPKLLQDCICFGFSGAMGQMFIFLTISIFDCYFQSIILTCQKFITIVYSNWRFGHAFNEMQWLGFLIVSVSGIIEMYMKQNNKQKRD